MASEVLEERRVVTVLFADVVGYTRLSEHLDPERVKRLLDGSFAHLIDDIERFGGQVDKVMGDGILALFGAPISHEDDPDRAVRCAIEMHRSLAEYVAAQPDLVQPVRLRVGVNTGEVVVGRVSGTDDYTALGDAVNVASRLQVMAPPGGTFIGSSTEEQLSADIRRELVADAEVRGREQTERVWRVLGRSARVLSAAARTPHDYRFVGRTVQRELFDSVMRLVADGSGAVIAVSGEAGSGKTRLVEEAIARFPGNAVVFSGVCAPFGETNVWAPVADAMYRLMDLDRNAPPALIREVVAERGAELYGLGGDAGRLHRFVEGVLHLFGHPSELDRVPPAQSREILFQFVVESVVWRSVGQPVIVWLDDVQWADGLLLELFTRLARTAVERPVLIVTAQRDEPPVDWPPAHLEHPLMVRMPLEPLTNADSHELLAQVVGGELAPELADQLYERSGGNPLFLTQLAQIARDDPTADRLPGSLRSLVASQLDMLSPELRAVVDNAAVLGATGPVFALEGFAGSMEQEFDRSFLDELVAGGFFLVDGDVWRFRSDVVREVAYQTLTKSARAQRHAGTASVMGRLDLAPIDQVAHHAASAAELVRELGSVPGVPADIDQRAIDWLLRATERSLELGAFGQAVHTAGRALALDPDPATVRQLRLLRAEAASERRESEAALEDAEAVLALAVEADDVMQEAVARRIIGVLAQQRGDLPTARTELDHSVALLTELVPDGDSDTDTDTDTDAVVQSTKKKSTLKAVLTEAVAEVPILPPSQQNANPSTDLNSAETDLGGSPSAQAQSSDPTLVVELDSSRDSGDTSVATSPTTSTSASVQTVTPDQAADQLRSSDQVATLRTASALGLDQAEQALIPPTPTVEELQTVLEQVESQRLAERPAVLQVRFTKATDDQQGQKDGFLDLTLISAKAPVEARRVEVDRKRFAGLLKALYRQLSRQEPMAVDNPASPTRQLHSLLVAPLTEALQAQGIQTLLIAADQGLQAVPFAALNDGSGYFGDRYAFALTPSLALTPLSPSVDAPQGQLALGASQFEGLAPLPLVPQELERIDASTGADRYLNSEFSPQALLDRAADQRYSRVHVATHADFRPGGPERSVLHTGTGPMSMAQFARLRKERSDQPLDLVVLSACRTLLGDKDSELGFAGLALQAGARSAIGTLWYVDDVVTSAFFVQFYRLLDQGVPKAQALQRTRQLFSSGLVRLSGDEVIGGGGTPLLNELSASQRRRIVSGVSNPFFWAGIELIGSPW